ncbi:MAG: DUF2382 domain-containing protein, partial [Chloroflexota bacterium]|nr:DUF2382 domain-containing protein [Chloroflexota bacterium]
MDTTNQSYQFYEGDEVYAADGDKIGKLTGISGDYLVIEKGWLFPNEYHVPVSAVSQYNEADHVIHLSVSKEQALNSGWDTIDTASYDTTISGAVAEDTWVDDRAATTTGTDHITVPVHEEELTATTRERAAGDVRVSKRVVEEDQVLDVPVTEERVSVTRRTVDRDATTGENVFTEETIDVPLRAEEVDLQKRTRVAEEIEIDKERVQRTERVGGTVRREEV